MKRLSVSRQGFTLLEVTFATGILFLSLVMMMGALAHLSMLRESGERRQLANHCLNHCLEQLRSATTDDVALAPPQDLPGEYTIEKAPIENSDLFRVIVRTQTTGGQAIEVVGFTAQGGESHGS